jgi:hypothetical protein
MRERGTTLSAIVTAEQARKPQAEGPEPVREGRRTLVVAALALGLIVLGIASVSAAIIFSKKSAAPVVTTSIIFPNRTVSVDTAKGPLAEALTSLRTNENPSLGEIEKITVLVNGTPIAPQDLATALGAPEPVAREITDVMIGIHAFDRNQPFIIFRISAYDRSFAAALAWEPAMARSLGTFFAPLNAPDTVPRITFSDAVLQNIDVRRSGNVWPILYAFPTQDLLIITTNEYTLREILTRLGTGG